MKVCHITTVHPAQDARIFHRMCRGLARRNIDVTLIAPESFKSEPHLWPSPFNDRIGRSSRLRRSAIALRAALAESADVYHFHDPELIPMALALKILRRGKAVVYDVHEDYPSMMRDKYWLPPSMRPAAALGARLANRIAGRFLDGIVVADAGVAADFRKSADEKILIYHNFPSLDLFVAGAGPAEPSADLVYLGGLSERAGIFVLFDALEILAQRGVRPSVRLAGYTDGEKGLMAINAALCRLGLADQVEFHGRLAHHDVPAWLRGGRIGLVMLQTVPKFMKNIPSKMFEYWACGLPVLASNLPPARQFLVEGKTGYLFAASSAAHLADRIAHLLQRPGERAALGRAGRRMIETEWHNEREIHDLVGFYETLMKKYLSGDVRARRGPMASVALTSPRESLED